VRLVAASLAVLVAGVAGGLGGASAGAAGNRDAAAATGPGTLAPSPPLATGPPTREQIRALLRTEITPVGPASEIAAVLRTGGYQLPFQALTAGLAHVEWDSIPPGGEAHAAAQARTLEIARGSLAFAGPGTGTLVLRLTLAGRALLESERASHVVLLRVGAKATFTPVGLADARPITAVVKQAPAAAMATPRCFGAASHDPVRGCDNPRLRLTVTPTPGQALITPNAPCSPASLTGLVIPCVFGVPQASATAQVALLGDSHAETWRGALARVADALHWNAVSLTRSSCSYSDSIPTLAPSLAVACLDWRAGVVAWFAANPQVSTVFVADNDLGEAFGATGKTPIGTQVTGYLDAWRGLPRSIRHIIVIRDSPFPGIGTASCVEAAIAHHKPAGVACALPRAAAVYPDPAAIAAYRDEPRASVIDLTDFFCGAKVCPPVIGGVLVYKDASHMTNLYSTTLGPYLLARVRVLNARAG
jgi:SGNH domain-containing protein